MAFLVLVSCLGCGSPEPAPAGPPPAAPALPAPGTPAAAVALDAPPAPPGPAATGATLAPAGEAPAAPASLGTGDVLPFATSPPVTGPAIEPLEGVGWDALRALLAACVPISRGTRSGYRALPAARLEGDILLWVPDIYTAGGTAQSTGPAWWRPAPGTTLLVVPYLLAGGHGGVGLALFEPATGGMERTRPRRRRARGSARCCGRSCGSTAAAAAAAPSAPAPGALPAALPPGTSRLMAAMCCHRFADPRCTGALGDRSVTCAALAGACHTCAANWGSAESAGDPLAEVTAACGRACR